ncbi:MAG: putative ABC transporter permease [bacterium]|nr:putative ABC transporter permease [bacterium]
METVAKYFIYFIIYAFLGWLMEVVCKLIENKRFINRGFLIGPICPIYGYGVLSIVLLIGSYKGDILSVFLKSIFVCSILEYITSYFMEKIFKARWWDYSTSRFNLNGRICLDTMIPFGILSIFVIYVLHPFIISLVSKISVKAQLLLALILFIIYLADNIFSYTIMNKIKNEIKDTNKDNTEAIKQYMVKWLDENSIFYRRIKDAYPNFIIKIKKLNNNIKEINEQAKEKYKKKVIK